MLHKVKHPKEFVFSCSIAGVDLKESLCDFGSSVNVMSLAITENSGIDRIQPPKMALALVLHNNSIWYIP